MATLRSPLAMTIGLTPGPSSSRSTIILEPRVLLQQVLDLQLEGRPGPGVARSAPLDQFVMLQPRRA